MKKALCEFTNKAQVKGSIQTEEQSKVLFAYTGSSSITSELVGNVQYPAPPEIKEAPNKGTCDLMPTK